MLYTKQKNLEGHGDRTGFYKKERVQLLMVEILSNIVEFRNGRAACTSLHIQVITELLLKKLVARTSRYNPDLLQNCPDCKRLGPP